MKKLALCLAIGAQALVLTTGCIERTVYVPAGQAVAEAPPPPQQEVIVAAPGPEYVWAPGYWSWHDHWVWVGGGWVVRPHPRAVWVGGNWVRGRHGYVWVRGHWR